MKENWSRHIGALLVGLIASLYVAAGAASLGKLQGSRSSVERQYDAALEHDFTFIRNPAQVEQFVAAGYLVPVKTSRTTDLVRVSFPYARPQLRLFIKRLSAQYHAGCGEKLVVTSLTRPKSRQPRNAADKSVHPTGMAVDVRRSRSTQCRNWLEKALSRLEKEGVLEASRERRPPHYHIALYAKPYIRYLARKGPGQNRYVVRRGDSLWKIAKRFATSTGEMRAFNMLSRSTIFPGQVLIIP